MTPLLIDAAGATLAARLHEAPGDTGVLIATGGAQTRVGAHGMFVALARQIAAAGIPVLRFDRRGTGDSDGDDPGFEAIGDDIAAASAAFRRAAPNVRHIVGLGHCDGATALALGGRGFAGLVLLNIWTLEEGAAPGAAAVGAHYRRRLLQPASWRRLLTGQVDLFGAIGSLLAARKPVQRSSLAGRVADALEDSPIPLIFICAGRDATANAAKNAIEGLGETRWLANADHSFSDPADLGAVAEATIAFVRMNCSTGGHGDR